MSIATRASGALRETPIKWLLSIEVHAAGDCRSSDGFAVAADLSPVIDRYWHRDCGRELRFRLETLFRDNRSLLGDDFRNPATREALGIGRRHKGKVKIHAAMPYESVPGFVAALDPALPRPSAAEAADPDGDPHQRSRGACWPEFDLEQRLWTIPAARVKNGADHHVPLTDEILAVLASIGRKDGEERLFPTCQPYTMLDTLKRNPGLRRLHRARLPFRLPRLVRQRNRPSPARSSRKPTATKSATRSSAPTGGTRDWRNGGRCWKRGTAMSWAPARLSGCVGRPELFRSPCMVTFSAPCPTAAMPTRSAIDTSPGSARADSTVDTISRTHRPGQAHLSAARRDHEKRRRHFAERDPGP